MSIRKILFHAVAGIMISPALMAADIDTSTKKRVFSDEFLGTYTDAGKIAADTLQVILGTEYTLGDIVTLDFSGNALDESTVPATATGGAPTNVTFGLLSADTSQAIYRVTSTTGNCSGSGETLSCGTVVFAADDVLMFNARDVQAAGGVTVSFSAATDGGIPLDTRGNLSKVEYITVKEEYSITVAAFNAVIDVEEERTTFAESTDDTSSVTVVADTAARADALGTTLVNVDIVWSGNFGWIVDGDPEMADVQFTDTVVAVVEAGADCTPIVVTAATIAATCPGAGPGAVQIDLTLAPAMNLDDGMKKAILPSTSFSVAVTVNYTGQDSTEGSRLFSEGAGSWTLNGFQAFLPYMPYGPSISQVIYLVNRGTQSGALIVDWVDQNGNSESLGTVATLDANTSFSIGPIINAALPMAQRTSGRLGLTITANVPAADVQINAQYNVSGNRAFVLHEDNRPDNPPHRPHPPSEGQ